MSSSTFRPAPILAGIVLLSLCFLAAGCHRQGGSYSGSHHDRPAPGPHYSSAAPPVVVVNNQKSPKPGLNAQHPGPGKNAGKPGPGLTAGKPDNKPEGGVQQRNNNRPANKPGRSMQQAGSRPGNKQGTAGHASGSQNGKPANQGGTRQRG